MQNVDSRMQVGASSSRLLGSVESPGLVLSQRCAATGNEFSIETNHSFGRFLLSKQRFRLNCSTRLPSFVNCGSQVMKTQLDSHWVACQSLSRRHLGRGGRYNFDGRMLDIAIQGGQLHPI